MAKPLSILYVSSEVFPYAKVGGLGDVSYSLPLAIRDVGHDIRVMLPKYGATSERKNRIHEINRLKDMPIKIGGETELATVKSSSINNPRSKVQAYVTTNFTFFDSKRGVYHDPKKWEEYPDNAERFIFFSRTVIETCLLLGWFPDIIHCNDWQTAMIPAYAKALFPSKFRKTKILFTIHDFSQQGGFANLDFAKTGLPKDAKQFFKHKNMINFMKGAIHYADYITTVSPTYLEEILNDKEYGNGLNASLKERSDKLRGIGCGADQWAWNPANDEFITFNYNGDYNEFKYKNKKTLLAKFDLKYDENIPIVAMTAKLDGNKGINLLLDAADRIFKENIVFILLGEGNEEIKKSVTRIAKKYPDKFKYKFAVDDILAHQITAGSDIMIIPSKHEPYGLNLMYALGYGAVPVARFTGAMKEIAEDFDPETKKGNSFVFTEYYSEALLKAFKRAVNAFEDKELWKAITTNGMNEDHSWSKAAQEYDEVYRNLMKD